MDALTTAKTPASTFTALFTARQSSGISALPSPSKSLLFAAILNPLQMNAVGLDSLTTPVPSAGAQRSGRQQTRWIPVFAGMMER